MEEFHARFHNLGGDSPSEHNRNFNIFLREMESVNFDRHTFVNALIPTTRQERVFFVRILIKFGDNEDILAAFCKGDAFINRILACKHRFVAAVIALGPEGFVARIAPATTFVTRAKLISGLSRLADVDVAEAFYKVIFDRYGARTAYPLVTACSPEFIGAFWASEESMPEVADLRALYGKGPDLVRQYFRARKGFECCKKFAAYLAKHDFALFRELLQYGVPKIGACTFRKLLLAHKDEIIADPCKFERILKKEIVYKSLTRDEYRTFFKNVVPKSVSEWSWENTVTKYLKLLPRNERGAVLFWSFRKVHGYDIYSVDDHFKESIVELLDLQDRLKFNLEKHPEMYQVEKSIPLIKEKINFTQDVNSRGELVEKLLRTCKINNDFAALLDVLEYYWKRHKNDNVNVRQNFANYLFENFPLLKLGAEYWDYFLKIMLHFEVNNEYYFNKANAWEKYIKYKVSLGLDYTDELKKALKERAADEYCLNLFRDDPKMARECIMRTPALLHEVFGKGEDGREHGKYFMWWLQEFNKKHPKLAISVFEFTDYTRFLIEETKNNRYYLYNVRNFFLRKPTDGVALQLYNEAAEANFTKRDYLDTSTIAWFLQNDSDIFSNAPECLFKVGNCSKRLIRDVMAIPHMYAKVREIAVAATTDPNVEDEKFTVALKILSMDPTFDYSALMRLHLPKGDGKVDLLAENINIVIQQTIIEQYRNRDWSDVAILYEYCKGDYVKYTLPLLILYLYNTPESLLEAPTVELLNKEPLVRTKAISTASCLGPQSWTHKFLLAIDEGDQANTVFKAIFGRFVDFRTPQFWTLLKDRFVPSANVKLKRLPKEHRSGFVQFVWEQLKQRGEEERLLKAVTGEMLSSISDNLCDELVNGLTLELKTTPSFIGNYLIYAGSQLDQRVLNLWKLLERSFQNAHNTRNVGDCFTSVLDLFKKIFDFLRERKEVSTVPDKLCEHFNTLKLPCSVAELRLLLNVSTFHLKHGNDPESLAKFMSEQLINFVNEYGNDAVDFYSTFASDFIDLALGSDESEKHEQQLCLVEHLVDIDESWQVKVLALALLPKKLPQNIKALERHKVVLHRIRANSSQVIHAYLYDYCRQLG